MAKISGTNSYDSSSNKYMNTQRASGMTEIGDNGGALAVTSTNIYVYSNGMKVGFVQSASPSESRNIVKVQELGTEGIIQSVPSNTTGGQLTVSRLAVYNGNLFAALGLTRTGLFVGKQGSDTSNSNTIQDDTYRTFGNPFKTLKDQRVPLEIQVRTRYPGDKQAWVIDTYLDCWLSSYSKSIAAGTITVTEQATIQYSDVIYKYTEDQ
ncbi:hypothetical protein D3C71_1172050 [compost metagenome]